MIDKHISATLACMPVCRVYRFVDDYFVLFGEGAHLCLIENVEDVLNVFKEQSCGIKFTFELPKNKCIQYLDINVSFSDNEHICWCY